MSLKPALLLWPVSLLLLGCDPCRTIEQTVQLSVEHNVRSRPIKDLKLRIREVRDRTEENARFYDADPNYRIASEWFSGNVDAEGVVNITLTEVAIDNSRTGSPVHRNAITGRMFECQILDGVKRLQSEKAVFLEGAIIVGELFTVTVSHISEPWYSRENEEVSR